MNQIVEPTGEEAVQFLTETYSSMAVKPLVVLVGKCTVEYSGRAKSFLGPGERVVIIKPDGVILVHRVGGRDPVNWQPPGTTIQWWAEKDGLVVEAVHHKQQERMVLSFSSVSMAFAKPMHDGGAFSIVGMEKDIVDSIEENPEQIEPGLVVVRREHPTKSGIIDLLCRDKKGCPVIVEAKRSSAGPSAAKQLLAYVSDIREQNPDAPVRGILVAPKVQPTARTILGMSNLECKELEPPRRELPRSQATMDKYF
ncbi:MAG: endonuclease NucS [Candidatus Thermoplasmatota archaeon]|nr:endonuclease NucS [Candidatus Thermoplasmatota archaeon]